MTRLMPRLCSLTSSSDPFLVVFFFMWARECPNCTPLLVLLIEIFFSEFILYALFILLCILYIFRIFIFVVARGLPERTLPTVLLGRLLRLAWVFRNPRPTLVGVQRMDLFYHNCTRG